MDKIGYFEYIRRANARIELVTAVEQKEQRVKNLESGAALAPSEDLCKMLREARAELQEARDALSKYDGPRSETTALTTPYGGFHPHWPGGR